MKTPEGAWGIHQLAALLGLTGQTLGRILNGQDYPTLLSMQKFEVVFHWPMVEQVQLLPYLWQEKDLRYSLVLKKHIKIWADTNPRTVKSGDVRMHPALPSNRVNGRGKEV